MKRVKLPKNFGKIEMNAKVKAFERLFLDMRKIYCRRCKVYMTQTVCKMIKGKTCTKGCKGRSR